MQQYKTCTTCGAHKPNTFTYFYRNDSCRGGITTQCKECYKTRARLSYKLNYVPVKNKTVVERVEDEDGTKYKRCIKCNVFKKQEKDFYAQPNNTDGTANACMECYIDRVKGYQNGERIRPKKPVYKSVLPTGVAND